MYRLPIWVWVTYYGLALGYMINPLAGLIWQLVVAVLLGAITGVGLMRVARPLP